jgi:hypothetical protein
MGKWLSADERKSIDQLEEHGLKPVEIAKKLGRDTRTVKHYLKVRSRERSVELEKQQRELDHRNDIRRRIGNLQKRLEFPSPLNLWIPDDDKAGKPVTKVGISLSGDSIEWEAGSSGYSMKLDEEYDPVIEHLHSSRHRAILSELGMWKQLGGKCIENCYKLRIYVEREAKEQTKLAIVPDTWQRGLLDGFCKSVYWSTFSSEEVAAEIEKLQNLVNAGLATKDNEYRLTELRSPYKQVSSLGNLRILNYAGFNIACLLESEVERVKDSHQRLITTSQNLSITVEIREVIAELKGITGSLRQRLDDFASIKILPGKCGLCPYD